MKRYLAYALLLLSLGLVACDTAEPGQMGVVRNGGPWDNKDIREGDGGIQCSNTGNVFNGWGSDVHWYPDSSAQHTFKFDDEGTPDAPPREVLTKDGYRMVLSGTYYFTMAFDCTEKGKELAKKFDRQFADRPVLPHQNFGGWLSLDVLPVIDGSIRRLSAYDCEAFVSSCNLVQRVADKGKGGGGSVVSIDAIESSLATELKLALTDTFGEEYFIGVKLQLNRPELAGKVQGSIEDAQAAFGLVTQAEARQQAANKDKETNKTRQEGYSKCPSCARQDEFKAFGDSLPDSVTSVTFGVPIAGR